MTEFQISFQIQGSGVVELPVTPLDNLIVGVNGLEVATFRFSVANPTSTDLTFNISATESGPTAGEVDISFDLNPVTILAGGSQIIVASIVPNQPLLEGDPLIDVHVVGTQV